MSQTTIADVQKAVRQIYRPEGLIQRSLLLGRPLICPFHTLIDCVPPGSSVLDIGCGSGQFLNVLRFHDRISTGIGFDASQRAIQIAGNAWSKIQSGVGGGFRHISVEERWPDGTFGVVSMIDVMHHIDPGQQRQVVKEAVSRVAPGGVFLYKDIGIRPAWRAWANRLHDLILARQWINYVASEHIIEWAENCGVKLEYRKTINMFWYGHELLVFCKPGTSAEGPAQ